MAVRFVTESVNLGKKTMLIQAAQKTQAVDDYQRDELLGKKSDLEVLGMSAKDLDKFFNPPPPKAKAPAKK